MLQSHSESPILRNRVAGQNQGLILMPESLVARSFSSYRAFLFQAVDNNDALLFGQVQPLSPDPEKFIGRGNAKLQNDRPFLARSVFP